ncbi:hypothetical protein V3W47_11855 [Deinococcus sp. YIM 134068]|uniref:hypothetical protein n=1 Tax=Deinococcus lichenicola TaxID=3118910 RepID=UPI002F9567A0
MRRLALPFVFASLLPAQAAPPAPSSPPRVEFTVSQDLVRRVTQGDRVAEQFVQGVKLVVPGDLLREEVGVRNVSGGVLRDVSVGMPVPRGTFFGGGATATTGRWRVEYSADDGRTYSATPKRRVTVSENGLSVTREVAAPVSEYTHVRWVLSELRAEETLKFSYRVRVK